MTEKRLIVRDGDYAWIDTTTGYVVEVEDAFDLINQLHKENEQLKSEIEKLSYANEDLLSEKRNWQRMSDEYCKLSEENEQLKSDLARVIEQARKNNELLVSDIRTLEKALWCHGCENDYDRLRELQKEFLND